MPAMKEDNKNVLKHTGRSRESYVKTRCPQCDTQTEKGPLKPKPVNPKPLIRVSQSGDA
jgi:hypothetical protein